jgi:DNA-binding NtrC family response regulator
LPKQLSEATNAQANQGGNPLRAYFDSSLREYFRPPGTLAAKVTEFERATVLAELERNHRHITNTAKALGLERSHLYKKCQQLGIELKGD